MSSSAARFNLPFNFALADAPPADLDPKLKPVFSDIFNALQQLQYVLHTYMGIGQRLQGDWAALPYSQTLHLFSPWRFYALAFEAVAYGAAINLFLSGGLLKIRNANATNNTKPCHGFCTTTGGIAVAAAGEVILCQGLLQGVAGLTVGTRYFLSIVDGLLTAVAPVAAGNIEQAVGIGMDATALLFNTDFDYIQH